MGFMDDVFGGSQTVDVLTRGQRSLLNSLTGDLQGQLGQGVPAYQGQITPDATANQLAAFQGVGGLGALFGEYDPQIASMLAGESAGDFNAEDYAQQAIYNPALLAYEDAQRDLEAKYGGSWGQTGGYQDIMQKGAARFATGIGEELADFSMYQQDTANAQRGLGVDASQQRTRNLADTYDQMLDFGNEERSIAGQSLGEDFNRWQAEQDYNNPWLGFLGPALGTQPYAVGQQPGWLSGVTNPGNFLSS